MCALGMTRPIHDSLLQSSIKPRHVSALQGPDNIAYDMHSTHGDFTRGPGDLHQELSHGRQTPFERGSSHRCPKQSLDKGDLGSVKGMQIGVGCPLFDEECHLPAPFVGPAND